MCVYVHGEYLCMSVCVMLMLMLMLMPQGYYGEVGDNPFSLLTLVIIQHQYHRGHIHTNCKTN